MAVYLDSVPFSGIIRNPPTWYTGPNYAMFNTMNFGHDISSMSSAAHEAFVAAPRASSSGSGFGTVFNIRP